MCARARARVCLHGRVCVRVCVCVRASVFVQVCCASAHMCGGYGCMYALCRCVLGCCCKKQSPLRPYLIQLFQDSFHLLVTGTRTKLPSERHKLLPGLLQLWTGIKTYLVTHVHLKLANWPTHGDAEQESIARRKEAASPFNKKANIGNSLCLA